MKQDKIIAFVIKVFVLVGCVAMAYQFITVLAGFSEAW
jgi:hypothetical protein